MNRAKTAFCILMLALAGCSNRGSSSSQQTDLASGIVGGLEAQAGDVATGGFANSVAFVYNDGIDCTGVLIAPTLVLTAAHCFFGRNLSLDARLMSVKLQSLETKLTPPLAVAKALTHPNFKLVKSLGLDDIIAADVDDLALVLLAHPAPESIQPAALSTKGLSGLSSKSATAAGYGSTLDNQDNDGSETVGTLRYASFQKNDLGMTGGMILVKTTSSGVCHGDSGGPLFEGDAKSAQNVVLGINDFSLPVPKTFFQKMHWMIAEETNNLNYYSENYPNENLCLGVSGFVDVASHRAWIVKAAASLGVSIQ